MDVPKLREQYRNSPEWAFVSLYKRFELLEAKVAELSKPKKRGRPRKVKE